MATLREAAAPTADTLSGGGQAKARLSGGYALSGKPFDAVWAACGLF
jgi:hypothetical protein